MVASNKSEPAEGRGGLHSNRLRAEIQATAFLTCRSKRPEPIGTHPGRRERQKHGSAVRRHKFVANVPGRRLRDHRGRLRVAKHHSGLRSGFACDEERDARLSVGAFAHTSSAGTQKGHAPRPPTPPSKACATAGASNAAAPKTAPEMNSARVASAVLGAGSAAAGGLRITC